MSITKKVNAVIKEIQFVHSGVTGTIFVTAKQKFIQYAGAKWDISAIKGGLRTKVVDILAKEKLL